MVSWTDRRVQKPTLALKLYGPGGTVRWASIATSAADGPYLEKLLQEGGEEIVRRADVLGRRLMANYAEVRVENADLYFSDLMSGADYYGSKVEIYAGMAGWTIDQWRLLFTGRVRGRSWSGASGTLSFTDIRPSLPGLPNVTLADSDFAALPEKYKGRRPPWRFGRLESETGTGGATLWRLDNAATTHYLVGVGINAAVDVTKVYKDGVEQNGANWSFKRDGYAAKIGFYSYIEFTSDPGEGAVITADVDGAGADYLHLETGADGYRPYATSTASGLLDWSAEQKVTFGGRFRTPAGVTFTNNTGQSATSFLLGYAFKNAGIISHPDATRLQIRINTGGGFTDIVDLADPGFNANDLLQTSGGWREWWCSIDASAGRAVLWVDDEVWLDTGFTPATFVYDNSAQLLLGYLSSRLPSQIDYDTYGMAAVFTGDRRHGRPTGSEFGYLVTFHDSMRSGNATVPVVGSGNVSPASGGAGPSEGDDFDYLQELYDAAEYYREALGLLHEPADWPAVAAIRAAHESFGYDPGAGFVSINDAGQFGGEIAADDALGALKRLCDSLQVVPYQRADGRWSAKRIDYQSAAPLASFGYLGEISAGDGFSVELNDERANRRRVVWKKSLTDESAETYDGYERGALASVGLPAEPDEDDIYWDEPLALEFIRGDEAARAAGLQVLRVQASDRPEVRFTTTLSAHQVDVVDPVEITHPLVNSGQPLLATVSRVGYSQRSGRAVVHAVSMDLVQGGEFILDTEAPESEPPGSFVYRTYSIPAAYAWIDNASLVKYSEVPVRHGSTVTQYRMMLACNVGAAGITAGEEITDVRADINVSYGLSNPLPIHIALKDLDNWDWNNESTCIGTHLGNAVVTGSSSFSGSALKSYVTNQRNGYAQFTGPITTADVDTIWYVNSFALVINTRQQG